MIRLDEKQYRAVKKMARAACANNDCGNCLLLDDGETCVCVHDGHVEDGDGKAHYPIKFTIVWDGCPEPVEIIKTIN